MNFLYEVLTSNFISILFTLVAGAALYIIARRVPLLIVAGGYIVSVLLIVSALLDIGEVYNYSKYYKRAFWHFGDDVTTWLGAMFVWAVLSGRRWLGFALAVGVLVSGTKISLAVIAFEIAVLWLFGIVDRRWLAANVGKALGLAGVMYVILVVVSPSAILVANKFESVGATIASGAKVASAEPSGREERFERTPRGGVACAGMQCLYGHLQRPLEDRLYSSIGGLWMALQGGFSGANYPSTNVQFADLMIEANPWGINDRFGISHERWMRIGSVQTPYLQFGAGYGVVPMVLLILAAISICVVAIRNVVDGERGSFVAFGLFFVSNAVVNMTQPWLNVGPVLLLMGFCAAHILFWRWSYFQRASGNFDHAAFDLALPVPNGSRSSAPHDNE